MKLVKEHSEETGSEISKQIINNFTEEVKNFVQVCPKEMLNKIKNPISLKSKIKLQRVFDKQSNKIIQLQLQKCLILSICHVF